MHPLLQRLWCIAIIGTLAVAIVGGVAACDGTLPQQHHQQQQESFPPPSAACDVAASGPTTTASVLTTTSVGLPDSEQAFIAPFPETDYIPQWHTAAEAAAADPTPLPAIQPLGSAPVLQPEEQRAYLKSLYDKPKVEHHRSLRTARPKNERQPPPRGADRVKTFNSSNIHELGPTPINLRYIPHFLTPEECAHMIDIAERVGFSPSPVLTDDAEYRYDPSKRTSTTTFLPRAYDAVCERVEWRAARLTQVDRARVDPLQVVKYEAGQIFGGHYDGAEARMLRFTVFVYLTSVPSGEGGETDFPLLNMRFQPEQGSALFWSDEAGGGRATARDGRGKERGRVCFNGCAFSHAWSFPLLLLVLLLSSLSSSPGRTAALSRIVAWPRSTRASRPRMERANLD